MHVQSTTSPSFSPWHLSGVWHGHCLRLVRDTDRELRRIGIVVHDERWTRGRSPCSPTCCARAREGRRPTQRWMDVEWKHWLLSKPDFDVRRADTATGTERDGNPSSDRDASHGLSSTACCKLSCDGRAAHERRLFACPFRGQREVDRKKVVFSPWARLPQCGTSAPTRAGGLGGARSVPVALARKCDLACNACGATFFYISCGPSPRAAQMSSFIAKLLLSHRGRTRGKRARAWALAL